MYPLGTTVTTRLRDNDIHARDSILHIITVGTAHTLKYPNAAYAYHCCITCTNRRSSQRD
jgi:hypothetical protein